MHLKNDIRNVDIEDLINYLSPESEYVFYDNDKGLCINTEDAVMVVILWLTGKDKEKRSL